MLPGVPGRLTLLLVCLMFYGCILLLYKAWFNFMFPKLEYSIQKQIVKTKRWTEKLLKKKGVYIIIVVIIIINLTGLYILYYTNYSTRICLNPYHSVTFIENNNFCETLLNIMKLESTAGNRIIISLMIYNMLFTFMLTRIRVAWGLFFSIYVLKHIYAMFFKMLAAEVVLWVTPIFQLERIITMKEKARAYIEIQNTFFCEPVKQGNLQFLKYRDLTSFEEIWPLIEKLNDWDTINAIILANLENLTMAYTTGQQLVPGIAGTVTASYIFMYILKALIMNSLVINVYQIVQANMILLEILAQNKNYEVLIREEKWKKLQKYMDSLPYDPTKEEITYMKDFLRLDEVPTEDIWTNFTLDDIIWC